MSDLPVPAASSVPSMPPTDIQNLAHTVGGLSQRVQDFEGRMDRMERTSAEQHKENTTTLNSMMAEVRNGFAKADEKSAQHLQTKWPVIYQAAAVVLTVILAGGSLLGWIITSNVSRLEASQLSTSTRLENTRTAIASRIETNQTNFERDVRAMVVPRAEMEVVTGLRSKIIDTLEKRLERLEARTPNGR